MGYTSSQCLILPLVEPTPYVRNYREICLLCSAHDPCYVHPKDIYLKTREHLELNLNENVHVTLINSDRPIFDPTAGVARIRFCSEHLF